MTHEQNMMEYVKRVKESEFPYNISSIMIFDHLDFLYSAPKLGDFVATNEEGEVMDKPTKEQFTEDGTYYAASHKEAYKEYQSALDRILWKGWEVKRSVYLNGERYDCVGREKDSFCFIYNTYESLITSGVKLERIQRK